MRPSRAGANKRGWSLRRQIVYRLLSQENQVLCGVGHDPEFEEKVVALESLLPHRRDPNKRRIKHRFPTGFQRRSELYDQHSNRLTQHPKYHEFIARHGIIMVDSVNDLPALDFLGVPIVAICSNRITEHKVSKVIRRAK